MSTRWSSSSRSERADPALTGDILDLDRYMRGARGPTQLPGETRSGLVVDNGGAAVAPCVHRRPTRSTRVSQKRFSHDSGLSDGSYSRRRRRGGRVACATNGECAESLRAFRAHCERALRDQREQLATVARLCQRALAAREGTPPPPPATANTALTSTGTGSSTTSRSTAGSPPNVQVDECKTYKIIMRKLDELHRVYAARRPSVVPRAPPPRSSSASVSVSDKLVATDSPLGTLQRKLQCSTKRVLERGVGSSACVEEAPGVSRYADDAPLDCQYDLNDPVRLYAQAKRLTALLAETGGASGGIREGRAASDGRAVSEGRAASDGRTVSEGRAARRGAWLPCSLCRLYWHKILQTSSALCHQLFPPRDPAT